jgi:hypothetical protein
MNPREEGTGMGLQGDPLDPSRSIPQIGSPQAGSTPRFPHFYPQASGAVSESALYLGVHYANKRSYNAFLASGSLTCLGGVDPGLEPYLSRCFSRFFRDNRHSSICAAMRGAACAIQSPNSPEL